MRYAFLVFTFASLIGCSTYIVKNATNEKISVGGQVLKPNECVELTEIFMGDSLWEIKTVGDNPETIGGFVGYMGHSHCIVEEAQNKLKNERVDVKEVDTKPDCQKIIN